MNRILIVEDEAIVALDIQSQLENSGYDVVGTAGSAAEATQLAGQHRPDLVLMDIHLDGPQDGIDAAAEIGQLWSVPVVFLTAFVDDATLGRAKQVSPYGYLVKPFDQGDLHTTIQIALHKCKLDKQLQRERENLTAILDAQRHGTILCDEDGLVQYLSQQASGLLGVAADDAVGSAWRDLIETAESTLDRLDSMMRADMVSREDKVPVTIHDRERGEISFEVEVHDDPRDARRRILFLYDISQLRELRKMLDNRAHFQDIVGKSESIQQVCQLIREVSTVDSCVLIEGETGTGKELVARAIHNLSRRSDKPLLALNCAGMGEELAISQLFGHRRGAFTGAVDDQVGLFEAASGGTLFLDEIGDLPIRIQTMLLRVLEENKVMRIGESEARPVDARIVAATNRDLAAAVAEETFRADLWYRIRVARIHVPPLRERLGDVRMLVRQFVAEHCASMGKAVEGVSDSALTVLMAHSWPGNVRELKNALEFAVLRAKGALVQPHDLPPEVLEPAGDAGLLDDMPQDERSRIVAALQQAGGSRKDAADLLGISRATLYRRLAQFGMTEQGKGDLGR